MEKTINLIFKKPEDSIKADTLFHTISLLASMLDGEVADSNSAYFLTVNADPNIVDGELLYVDNTNKKALATLTDKDGNPAIFNLTTGDKVYCDSIFDNVNEPDSEDEDDEDDDIFCFDIEDEDEDEESAEEVTDNLNLPKHDIAVTLVKPCGMPRNIVDVSIHLSSLTGHCINNDLHNILVKNKFDIINKWEEARKGKYPRIDIYVACFDRDNPDKEVDLSCKFSSYEDFADWVDNLKLRDEERKESLIGDFWLSDGLFNRLTDRFRTFFS